MRYKNAGEVVAEILMIRAVKSAAALLIVEGTDDWKFWKPRVVKDCEVVNATGKATGVAAVRKLNSRSFVGHLGIVDRDYQDLHAASDWRINLIFWDGHSLETVLFCSGAFEKVVVENFEPGELTRLSSGL